jgi:hypothetical protein
MNPALLLTSVPWALSGAYPGNGRGKFGAGLNRDRFDSPGTHGDYIRSKLARKAQANQQFARTGGD